MPIKRKDAPDQPQNPLEGVTDINQLDFSEAEDMNEVLHTALKVSRNALHQERARLADQNLMDRVLGSQELERTIREDYDEVIERSGVEADLASGKDQELYRKVFNNVLPARAAYFEGCARLDRQPAKPRPLSQHETGPSTPREQSGVSREQIDAMTDDQKSKLFRENPKAKDFWLGRDLGDLGGLYK